jgi:hypothetical protein
MMRILLTSVHFQPLFRHDQNFNVESFDMKFYSMSINGIFFNIKAAGFNPRRLKILDRYYSPNKYADLTNADTSSYHSNASAGKNSSGLFKA